MRVTWNYVRIAAVMILVMVPAQPMPPSQPQTSLLKGLQCETQSRKLPEYIRNIEGINPQGLSHSYSIATILLGFPVWGSHFGPLSHTNLFKGISDRVVQGFNRLGGWPKP